MARSARVYKKRHENRWNSDAPMVRMQWWAYLLMLAVYIVYLLIGAAVFQKLEQPFEEKRCDDAKSKVREKKDEFGNEYFYIFGLNKKFCDGIDQWNKNETLSNNTSEVIKKLIMEWKSYDCSQEREDNAWKTIQNNKTQVQEYIKVWKAIAAPVLAKSFNDELLSIKGETVRKVMERTAQFGINNYLALKKDCTDHWNFHNAFFFAGTVATTIGYGNISPSTNHGKLFCITFTVIGIPYFAYMVGALAELISYKIDDIVKKFQSKSMTKISPGAISSLYVILGCILLIVIPSYVFTLVEDWSMLDAIYYSVISLTTIGFGDLIPRNEPPMSKAIHVKNESMCLCELINPVPSQDDVINNQTGLSKKCDPNEWPEDIKIVFNLYRVMVFFWILAGLTWLGGVVSMLTDLLNLSVSYQFDISISRVFRKGRVVFPPIWNLLGSSSNSESKYITKNANNRTADGKALYNMNNAKLAYMNKLNYNQLSHYHNRIRLDRSPIDDDNEFYRRIHNSTDIDEQVDLDDFQRRNRKNLTHVPMRITPLSRK